MFAEAKFGNSLKLENSPESNNFSMHTCNKLKIFEIEEIIKAPLNHID